MRPERSNHGLAQRQCTRSITERPRGKRKDLADAVQLGYGEICGLAQLVRAEHSQFSTWPANDSLAVLLVVLPIRHSPYGISFELAGLRREL